MQDVDPTGYIVRNVALYSVCEGKLAQDSKKVYPHKVLQMSDRVKEGLPKSSFAWDAISQKMVCLNIPSSKRSPSSLASSSLVL